MGTLRRVMRWFVLLALSTSLLLSACRIGGDSGETPQASDEPDADVPAGEEAPAGEPEPVNPRVSVPPEPTSVLADDSAGELALATSRALYEESPVVLLATGDDLGTTAQAASVAVRLGAPLLVVPPGAEEAGNDADAGSDAEGVSDAVAEEIDRLGATTLLVFDDAADEWAGERGGDRAIVRAPAEPAELGPVIGESRAPARTVAADEVTAAVAGLGRDEWVVLAVEDEEEEEEETAPDEGDTPAPSDGSEAADDEATAQRAQPVAAGAAGEDVLARLEPAPPLDSTVVLTSPGEAGLAAAATARAAGARVLVPDDPDPRADPDAIAALAGQSTEEIVALGDDFGDADQLRDRVEVAATGVELPGGGQLLFPGRRMVALYGHPDLPALGALGEQPLEQTFGRAEEVAANYEPHSDVPVVPTFEIIATIASASPGSDGNYSDVAPVEALRPWVDEAREAGYYVVLDLQPGRTDFLTQAQHYEELLLEPHVGLALDPEWRLEPDQVHLEQIGSVDAEEVNTVVDWLADLTREHRLPQKLLVLHQFRHAMLPDRDAIDTTRDELAVLIHADGHGTPDVKRETWNALTESPPSDVYWGWKNFYDQDNPTWSAEEVLELEPDPLFISYQ